MVHVFSLKKSESGQVMVEYGLIVCAIAILLIAALISTTSSLQTLFNTVHLCFTNPNAANCPA